MGHDQATQPKVIHVQLQKLLTCNGVPVKRSLLWVLKLISVCHLWLWKFFILWASSRIR